jgi:superfamily II DNA/RNA helicase
MESKTTMHHLTPVKENKKEQLFKILSDLKKEAKSLKQSITRIIILTESNLTADYLSCCLNLKGLKATSIHKFKSDEENDKTRINFNRGQTEILITDHLEIKVTLPALKNIINYDMFVPNILYFEQNQSDDVFHII